MVCSSLNDMICGGVAGCQKVLLPKIRGTCSIAFSETQKGEVADCVDGGM